MSLKKCTVASHHRREEQRPQRPGWSLGSSLSQLRAGHEQGGRPGQVCTRQKTRSTLNWVLPGLEPGLKYRPVSWPMLALWKSRRPACHWQQRGMQAKASNALHKSFNLFLFTHNSIHHCDEASMTLSASISALAMLRASSSSSSSSNR